MLAAAPRKSRSVPTAPTVPRPAAGRGRKGDLTRAAILDAALALARRDGLEGLTIGVLAERLGMSKSGVFAHFGSREDLQLAVLRDYAARFVDLVLRPAVGAERGLPRLRAIVERWLALLAEEIEAGCIMISGASEYDDRPGPLRDAMVDIVVAWKRELLRALEQARQCGDLPPDADCEQMVFEIYGLMLMLHQDARLLRSKDSLRRARSGLQRLIEGGAAAPRMPAAARRGGPGTPAATHAAATRKAASRRPAPRKAAPAQAGRNH